jgi:hypothetical protein
MQLLDYLVLINVVLPQNVQYLIIMFRDGLSDLIPNFLNFGEDHFCPRVADKFRENDMGCYLGNNCGGEIGIILLTLVLFGVAKAVISVMKSSGAKNSKLAKNSQKEPTKTHKKIIKFLQGTFNYQMISNTMFGFMMDILLSSYLMIYVGTQGNALGTISIGFSFVFLAIYSALNVFTILRQNKLRKALQDPVMKNHIKNKFSDWMFMVEDLKNIESPVLKTDKLKTLRQVSIFIESIINFRDIFIGMMVVFFQANGTLQVLLILLLQVSTTVVLLLTNPYKDLVFSVFLFAKEIFYGVTLIIFLIIVNEPSSLTEVERRQKYSTPLLISIGGIILSGLIQLIINTVLDGKDALYSLCKKNKVGS